MRQLQPLLLPQVRLQPRFRPLPPSLQRHPQQVVPPQVLVLPVLLQVFRRALSLARLQLLLQSVLVLQLQPVVVAVAVAAAAQLTTKSLLSGTQPESGYDS